MKNPRPTAEYEWQWCICVCMFLIMWASSVAICGTQKQLQDYKMMVPGCNTKAIWNSKKASCNASIARGAFIRSISQVTWAGGSNFIWHTPSWLKRGARGKQSSSIFFNSSIKLLMTARPDGLRRRLAESLGMTLISTCWKLSEIG